MKIHVLARGGRGNVISRQIVNRGGGGGQCWCVKYMKFREHKDLAGLLVYLKSYRPIG